MTTKTYLFSYIQQGPLFEEKRKRFGGASGIDVFVLCRNADENTFDKDLVAGVVIDSGFQFRTSLSYLQLIFGGNEDVPIDKLREIRLRIDDLAKSKRIQPRRAQHAVNNTLVDIEYLTVNDLFTLIDHLWDVLTTTELRTAKETYNQLYERILSVCSDIRYDILISDAASECSFSSASLTFFCSDGTVLVNGEKLLRKFMRSSDADPRELLMQTDSRLRKCYFAVNRLHERRTMHELWDLVHVMFRNSGEAYNQVDIEAFAEWFLDEMQPSLAKHLPDEKIPQPTGDDGVVYTCEELVVRKVKRGSVWVTTNSLLRVVGATCVDSTAVPWTGLNAVAESLRNALDTYGKQSQHGRHIRLVWFELLDIVSQPGNTSVLSAKTKDEHRPTSENKEQENGNMEEQAIPSVCEAEYGEVEVKVLSMLGARMTEMLAKGEITPKEWRAGSKTLERLIVRMRTEASHE